MFQFSEPDLSETEEDVMNGYDLATSHVTSRARRAQLARSDELSQPSSAADVPPDSTDPCNTTMTSELTAGTVTHGASTVDSDAALESSDDNCIPTDDDTDGGKAETVSEALSSSQASATLPVADDADAVQARPMPSPVTADAATYTTPHNKRQSTSLRRNVVMNTDDVWDADVIDSIVIEATSDQEVLETAAAKADRAPILEVMSRELSAKSSAAVVKSAPAGDVINLTEQASQPHADDDACDVTAPDLPSTQCARQNRASSSQHDVSVNEADVSMDQHDVSMSEADVSMQRSDMSANRADLSVDRSDMSESQSDATLRSPSKRAVPQSPMKGVYAFLMYFDTCRFTCV